MPVNETIELIVPLRARFSLTVRLLSASLGADAGLTVDEIDDVRLAMSEVFSMLVPGREGLRASVRFAVNDASLTAVVSAADGSSIATTPDDLALSILRSSVDEFAFSDQEIRLVKRARELAQD